MAADRLQAVLDLEEPPARARPPRRRSGRPRAIRTISRANPLWGAPRIHGELQKLGLEISQATVSKYLVRRRTPPSQTWRTFLDNHIGSLSAVDFFVVPTVLFKVLFVFVVLAHQRRRVLHINVTDTLCLLLTPSASSRLNFRSACWMMAATRGLPGPAG